MRLAAVWAASAPLWASTAALAQSDEIRWAESWAEALEEAKARNVPIVVTVHKDG